VGAPSVHEVTQLLPAWSAGDRDALGKLTCASPKLKSHQSRSKLSLARIKKCTRAKQSEVVAEAKPRLKWTAKTGSGSAGSKSTYRRRDDSGGSELWKFPGLPI